MIITPTYHSMLRWNERIHNNYTNLNTDIVLHEVIDDFKESKLTKKKSNNIVIYKSEKNTFIAEVVEDEITIITLYPNQDEKIIEERLEFHDQDIKIKTRLDFTKKELRLISNVFKQEDYIELQTLGSKKYILINDSILLVRVDRMNNRIFLNILNKWNVTDLYDLEKFNEFEEEHQKQFKSKEWNSLLELLQLNKKIFISEQYEDAKLSEEVLIYKKVLDGELARFPSGFWLDDVGKGVKIAAQECTRYLFEEVLKWSKYDLYNNFNYHILQKYKLTGMSKVLFNDDYFSILDNAYPGQLKPWFFKKSKFTSHWKQENNGIEHCKEGILWLIEESKKDGFVINKDNLLSFDWIFLLDKYNLKEILTVTFNSDYKEFFKNLFNVEFKDEDIIRYQQYFELKLNQRFRKLHI